MNFTKKRWTLWIQGFRTGFVDSPMLKLSEYFIYMLKIVAYLMKSEQRAKKYRRFGITMLS